MQTQSIHPSYKPRRRLTVGTAFALSATIGLAGCSFDAGNDPPNTEPDSFKVMYYEEQSFYDQFGMLYSALHPNVAIDVISTNTIRQQETEDYQQALKQLIDEEQPDVLMLSETQYKEMAAEGRLLELDPLIERDNYDLEGVVPGLIDYIREQSDGRLFGLSPSFYSQAVFYNKDLFDNYGIPLPTDGMSWEQMLQLAQRFPTDGPEQARVYGLKAGYNTDLFQLGMMIGMSQGLNFVDSNNRQITLDTDSWERTYTMAADAIRSNTLYSEMNQSGTFNSTEDYLMHDPFIGGRLAMAVESSYLLDQLRQAKQHLGEKGVQNWDLVTMPADPQQPDKGGAMSVSTYFAINRNGANNEAAWKFIQYIHSDEYARVKSKSRSGGGFPIRSAYIKDDDGHNLAAFYKLKPGGNSMYAGYENLPADFINGFMSMATKELSVMIQEDAPVRATLASLEMQGQQMLDEAIAAEGADETAQAEGQ
ncbi:extracellular solute-binding protein [Paenibacillus sp. IB182496]|uniref:Extracellular solute-binding protein n=1 Tax=Paenibacillus sabuli TaxID=2772509 RepID=A0A927BX56_9BACL|nr:extracellular solute-binding protein [Paenibacillus sabuli]MBD2846968.1 extracellular solute-binding protein [Paenibacillus sabuli]